MIAISVATDRINCSRVTRSSVSGLRCVWLAIRSWMAMTAVTATAMTAVTASDLDRANARRRVTARVGTTLAVAVPNHPFPSLVEPCRVTRRHAECHRTGLLRVTAL